MHADHHVDLIPLRHHLRYQFDEPRSIGLHVPDELRRRYDVFCGEAGFLRDLVGPELVAGAREIGPFAKPGRVWIVPDMPKTRSGKIMRRVLAAISNTLDTGDITTLANPDVVEIIRVTVQKEG